MPKRTYHQEEARNFLRTHFLRQDWEFTFPSGSGGETYFAFGEASRFFIKLGSAAALYQAAASLGIAPPVLASGTLRDGTSILVQPYLAGTKPTRQDYHDRMEAFAAAIHRLHHSSEILTVLPQAPSPLFRAAGAAALERLQRKWEPQRPRVAKNAARFVDQSLADLRDSVLHFEGGGLVASHNDLCNANWLIAKNGQLYILDLEEMAPDDPAVDLGATLWWYYPPELREKFLAAAGYAYDAALKNRMQVRMAMHCLSILLPREHSFDRFDPDSFEEALTDFKAVLAGLENPQGYA